MKKTFSSVLAAVAVAATLAACGGGGDSDIVFEDEDPESSGRSGSVTLAGAATAALNGIYSSNDVFLSAVEKFNPIGSDPELCRFRFDGLELPDDSRVMSGSIRYQPGTPTVRVMFIKVYVPNSISDVEYSLDGPEGATVDRTNDEVDFLGARFTSTSGPRDTITLSGSIPMRDGRPEGC